jgi:hypothetical protein
VRALPAAADKAKDAVAADLAAAAPKSSIGMATAVAEAITAVAAEATMVAAVAKAAAATAAAAAVAAASMAAAATMTAALAVEAADPLPTERQQTPSSISKAGIIATRMVATWMTTTPAQGVPAQANIPSVLPPV